MDWYEEYIEEGVRNLVKFLRNNGINTECSCHHENPMYIQCQYMPNGSVKDIHDLLWLYFTENNQSVTFSINLRHEVIDGCAFSSLDIKIPKAGVQEKDANPLDKC